MKNISASWSFSDPLDYDRFIRASNVESIKVSGSQFSADLVRADFGMVWMQSFRETAPRIARIAPDPSRCIILFRTNSQFDALGMLRHGGYDMQDDKLLFLGQDTTENQLIDGDVSFGSMSLSPEKLDDIARIIDSGNIQAKGKTGILQPEKGDLFEMRFLHQKASHIARTQRQLLNNPQVARAFENHLALAMVRCLGGSKAAKVSPHIMRRAALIGQLEEYIETHSHEAIYMAELCRGLSISVRTLERVCHEHLGMGPLRYLWLRRLHLARRALVQHDTSSSSVSKIAAAYGFWEFGRFSMRYKQIFGEVPSVTLQKARRDLSRSSHPLSL